METESLNTAYLFFLIGLVVIIVTLLRLIRQKARRDARKEQDKEAQLKTAKELERQSRMISPIPQAKVTTPKNRMPVPANPLGPHFTGGIQGHAAKWEAEIHQLGRQIIGQIDSKMAALQAINIDANRTANRLEILVEHLENIAREQIDRQQASTKKLVHTESDERMENDESSPISDQPSTVALPNTGSETIQDVIPLSEMLEELTEDLDDIHTKIQRNKTFNDQYSASALPSATILRMEEEQSQKVRNEVEMLANYGMEPMEIAGRLNLSLGEVDLILQVQQSGTGQ